MDVLVIIRIGTGWFAWSSPRARERSSAGPHLPALPGEQRALDVAAETLAFGILAPVGVVVGGLRA